MEFEPKRRVLLVEDNSGDEMLTLRALRHFNAIVSVFVARDGEQAVQVIRRMEGQLEDYPSLIILDLSLPKVSGLEVLALVKGNPKLADIPVTVVTGNPDPDIESQCVLLGANAFLSKPIGYTEYFEMLRPIFLQTLGHVSVAATGAMLL